MSEHNGNAYLNTIARLEPEITPIDMTAAAASIAISLKRIADSLDKLTTQLDGFGLRPTDDHR